MVTMEGRVAMLETELSHKASKVEVSEAVRSLERSTSAANNRMFWTLVSFATGVLLTVAAMTVSVIYLLFSE